MGFAAQGRVGTRTGIVLHARRYDQKIEFRFNCFSVHNPPIAHLDLKSPNGKLYFTYAISVLLEKPGSTSTVYSFAVFFNYDTDFAQL